MLDSKTLYKYIKIGLFSVSTLDLQRVVKMRPRKKKKSIKIEPACRVGRTYRDFLSFVNENPDTPIVQMDTLVGKKGGTEPVLLTIHFVQSEFMIAFFRKNNTAKSVLDVFDYLYALLGAKTFSMLFPVILTDNGSEFSNPSALEFDSNGQRRTRIFYCDPNSSWQKGSCETNHSLLRLVIPKGVSFSPFGQPDFDLLLSHVNSYARKKLNGKTPFATFSYLFEEPWILDKFNMNLIKPNSVVLKPSLLKR
jgi:IS30 family transposase